MSRSLTALAAASVAFLGLLGAAGAQNRSPDTDPQLAAEVPPQPGGPHRDPPGVLKVKPGCPQGWKPVPPGVNPALRCLPDHLVAALPRQPSVAPPPGCPKGWKPVSPAINPVLRCQPGQLAANQPPQLGPKRPIGCPDGWRPVPPGVNPLLRCLPDEIAATPPPGTGQAAPPPGCPKGWKPVPPGVNPLMRCLPGQVAAAMGAGPQRVGSPQRVGPDPGEPEQAGVGGRPDLALIGAFQIGNQAVAWGTSATLLASDAAFTKGGRCGFRYKYTTRNQGGLMAGATSNRILLDAQDGPVLATAALPALAPGATANSSGHVLLVPGTWTLYVHADAPLAVIESDETNNLRRVRVTVEGDC